MTDQTVSPTPDAETPGLAMASETLIDEAELEAIVTEVLDALVMNAGLDLGEPFPPEHGLEKAPIHGTIVVHADTEACLVIESDTVACAALARCWGLVGPGGATLPDAQDALGELCNLIGATVKTVFDERFPDAYADEGQGDGPVFDEVLRWFQSGGEVELTDHLGAGDLVERLRAVPGLEAVTRRYLAVDDDAHLGPAMELVLEGLTQSSLLAREELLGGRRYRDMLSEMAESLRG